MELEGREVVVAGVTDEARVSVVGPNQYTPDILKICGVVRRQYRERLTMLVGQVPPSPYVRTSEVLGILGQRTDVPPLFLVLSRVLFQYQFRYFWQWSSF
jgi:hypothetical protein